MTVNHSNITGKTSSLYVFILVFDNKNTKELTLLKIRWIALETTIINYGKFISVAMFEDKVE